LKNFSLSRVLSHAKVKTIMQVMIIWITAMFTIFTVFMTQNHKACKYGVALIHQKSEL